jgi:hypothetical protein
VADGAVTAVGAVALIPVAADTGSAREATMALEIMITAEVFVAGLAEREMADEKDDAVDKWLGARRPDLWFDIVRRPLQTPTRSAVGFGWEICTRPSRR